MSMGWYDSRASNTLSRGAGFEVDGHPSCYMYMYMCMYRKRSNYSARKKELHFTLALKYELRRMLSFLDGALIRVALPNWNESTLNARPGTFTRSGNSSYW